MKAYAFWMTRLIRITIVGFVLLVISGIVRYRHAYTPLPFEALEATSSLPIIVGMLLAITVIVMIIWLSHLPERFLLPFAMFLAGILRAWWVSHIETTPVYDFLTVSDAARSIASGDFHVLKSPYFTRFSYQIPFALWESFFYRLFGKDHHVLEWLNVWIYVWIPLLGYSLTVKLLKTDNTKRMMVSKRIAKAVALFWAIEPSSIIMSSVLTNQYSALFFYLLSLLATMLAIESSMVLNKLAWAIAAGVFLAMGGLLRPLAIVYITALFFYMVASFFLSYTKSDAFAWRSTVKRRFDTISPLLTIVVYVALTQAVSSMLMAFHITDRPLTNDEPEWKFVVGLNRATIGHFSKEDADLVLSYGEGEARRAFERTLIIERLREPGFIAFLITKLQYLWGFVDQGWKWAQWEPPGEWLTIVLVYERLLFMLMLIGLVFVPIKEKLYYPLWIVVIYVGIHLLIEIQVRYRYDLLLLLYMLGTIGLGSLWRIVRKYPAMLRMKKNNH